MATDIFNPQQSIEADLVNLLHKLGEVPRLSGMTTEKRRQLLIRLVIKELQKLDDDDDIAMSLEATPENAEMAYFFRHFPG